MPAQTSDSSSRVTASLTKEQYRVLRALADKHRVSVSWLVRYAVNRLVEQADAVQLPLDFGGPNNQAGH
jgi:hypothetical protein